MVTITEGNLEFRFPDRWEAIAYDKCGYYSEGFQNFMGSAKAVDIAARNVDTAVLWLIEVKDFRGHPRSNPEHLWDQVASKVRDTIVGLVGRQDRDGPPVFPLDGVRVCVVLHLEQSPASRLKPLLFDPGAVRTKLRQLLRPLVAEPKVVDTRESNNHLSWHVSDMSAPPAE